LGLEFIGRHFPSLLAAASTTISLTLLTMALSTAAGIPLAILRNSNLKGAATAVAIFSWVMRALPTLL
jgi:ABC-type amino acid transport system permease subunit